MKTRELTGMTVTEITAPDQVQLFKKLAKFAAKGRGIDSLSVRLDEDEDQEVAVVVWA